MSNETPESVSITKLTEVVAGLQAEMKMMTGQIQIMDERQRTIMVGWNGFLKSAEAQLRAVFKGNIPAPMLKKLLQMAFKGMDEAERRGK